MRSIITFTVTGQTRDELLFKATEAYAKLLGDDKAQLPSGATIDISPETVTTTGDGRSEIALWEGHVSVTTNDDGPTR